MTAGCRTHRPHAYLIPRALRERYTKVLGDVGSEPETVVAIGPYR
ncbi:MAG TPA: hypothetical protein VI585_08070 [Candidatus Binatia bacterium]